MNQCPFLSTANEKISCFKTCPFNKNDEECPFKILESKDIVHVYDYFDSDLDHGLTRSLEKINW